MFFSYFIPCFKLFFPLLLGFLMVFFVSVHSLSTRFPSFFVSSPSLVCSLLSLICSPFSLAFPLSLRFFFFSSLLLSSLRSLSFGSFSSSSFLPLLGAIYRASDRGCSLWRMGAGLAAAGRPLGATAEVRLPRFFFGQARGGWSASVFGRWSNGMGPRVGRWAPGERGPDKI
jgi:hypothetical protein